MYDGLSSGIYVGMWTERGCADVSYCPTQGSVPSHLPRSGHRDFPICFTTYWLWWFCWSTNLGTHPSIDSSPNILISIDDKERKWEKFISHLFNQYFLLYRCSPIQSNKTWSDAFERVASARCDFASKDGHVIAICWVRGVEGRQCIAMFSFLWWKEIGRRQCENPNIHI